MAKIKESFVKCKCGHRFNSPIFFGDTATFAEGQKRKKNINLRSD